MEINVSNKSDALHTLSRIMAMSMLLIMLMGTITTTASARDVSYQQLPYEETSKFRDDWYDTDAVPVLHATIVEDSTFSENEERPLLISLTNKGYVTTIMGSYDRPESEQENVSATMERKLEYGATTAMAINVKLTKANSDDPFEIKQDVAEAGMLVSGGVTNPTLRFMVEINDNAPSGSYPVRLDASYDYQDDVAVYPVTDNAGNTTYNQFIRMASDSMSQVLYISVDDHAVFEVSVSDNTVQAGKKAIIDVTLTNTGTEIAHNAVAHISVVDPFDAIVDDYYLGTMAPGESKVASFKVKTDVDSIPQIYGINTEVKYENSDGQTKYSDTLKTEVDVLAGVSIMERWFSIKPYVTAVVVVLIIGIVAMMYFKRAVKEGDEV
ncbi:MAG: hypothetical protein KAH86_01910 [Methanosarcinales archaeon]|nr:hypothetical protein [Methanosarcinales archaeon]